MHLNSPPTKSLFEKVGLKSLVRRSICFAMVVAVAIMPSTFTPANAATKTVVINEVDCHGNDWIELLNTSNESVDISNWLLTDKKLSVTNPLHIYRFPVGTVMAKKSRLIVEQTGTGDLQLPFGIGCLKGGVVRLGKPLSPTSMVLVDQLVVGVTPSGATFGRYPDGSLKTGLTIHSKNQPNKSALPKLTSPATISCSRGKACKVTLKSPTTIKFSLASKTPGVTLTSKGLLTISARNLKAQTLRVGLRNQFGGATTTVKIVLR